MRASKWVMAAGAGAALLGLLTQAAFAADSGQVQSYSGDSITSYTADPVTSYTAPSVAPDNSASAVTPGNSASTVAPSPSATVAGSSAAAADVPITINLKVGSKTASVNSAVTTLDSSPVVINGTTLVPIRFISESMGAEVHWNNADQSVTIQMNGVTIMLGIGKSASLVNGQSYPMTTPAQIIHGNTMVPVRLVSEKMGLSVGWSSQTQTITIKGKKSGAAAAAQSSASSSASSSAASSSGSTGAADSSSLSFFFHAWHLGIQGVSYTTDNYATDSETVTSSTGANLPDVLVINSDGTYTWNSSWDGKLIKGTWKKTQDSGYPILLVHGQSGDDWQVGKTTDGKGVYVYDGPAFVWFNGYQVK